VPLVVALGIYGLVRGPHRGLAGAGFTIGSAAGFAFLLLPSLK
jgi:hypothetical protein